MKSKEIVTIVLIIAAAIYFTINARKQIPSQNFISIGVAPPHLHLKSRIDERNAYESNLKKAGAALIINSVKDLIKIDLHKF